MNKCYYRIVWENYPSGNTPINEQNLNKIDVAADEMDNRIISLDASKLDKSEANLLVKYIEYDESTGIFKITHYNGASYEIDTLLEKLAINFDYDYQTQRLIIELSDGTVKYVDLSALITQYEFLNSDTIRFTISADGKVKADIIEGSIQEKHLRPNYLADIRVEASKAQQSAAASAGSAKESESWAHGGTGIREGENTDNSKYWSQQSKNYSDLWKGSLLPQGTIAFAQLPTSGNVAGHMYNISNAFETDARFKEGAGYSYPAGTNIYWTQDGKWDCLSGALTMELSQAEYDALTTAEKMNGTIYYIYDGNNSLEGATENIAGLMSPEDKKKLDGIAEGATRVIVDSVMDLQSENPVQNKVVTKDINDEINRAESAESVLSDAITAEAERARAQEALKAPIASPTLTGIPKAPTAPIATNSTQIATTAFVKMVINALVNGAPETLDTLKEIADAITENETVVQALNTAIGKKVNKSGDTMTGKLIANGGISLSASTTSTDLKYLLGIDAFADGGTVRWQSAEFAKVGEANKWANSRNINGMVIDGSENRCNYAECSTAANAPVKVVSCPGFQLVEGAEIAVKFIHGNTASELILNINNTGNEYAYYNGYPTGLDFGESNILNFRYDGNAWGIIGSGNIGVLDKYGGTVSGVTIFKQGTRVGDFAVGAGKNGFMHICQLKITNQYANQPIEFKVLQRERSGEIYLKFHSTVDMDPGLAYLRKTGNIDAYMVRSSANTWNLYIKKSEGYDNISVTELRKGGYMDSHVTIAWKNAMVTSLPSGYITAVTEEYNGNAKSATKLVNSRKIEFRSYGDVQGSFSFDGSKDVDAGLYFPRMFINKAGKYKIASCEVEPSRGEYAYESICFKVNSIWSHGYGGMLSVVAGAYINGDDTAVPIDSGASWEYINEGFKDSISFEVRDVGLGQYGGSAQELWATLKYDAPVMLLMMRIGNDYYEPHDNNTWTLEGDCFNREPDEPL